MLVILTLLFSSVFANNMNDCSRLADKYFVQIGRKQLATIVEINLEGRFFNQQEMENMFSVPGTNELVRLSTSILRKKGFYNAAIYIETALNKEPNMVNYFIRETFKKEYDDLMKNVKNNAFSSDDELKSFIIYYRQENNKDFNEIVNKLDSCIYY